MRRQRRDDVNLTSRFKRSRDVLIEFFSSVSDIFQTSQFTQQFRGMKMNMLRENLTLATRLKSKKDLQKALKDFADSGISPDDFPEFDDATRELDVIKMREGEIFFAASLFTFIF